MDIEEPQSPYQYDTRKLSIDDSNYIETTFETFPNILIKMFSKDPFLQFQMDSEDVLKLFYLFKFNKQDLLQRYFDDSEQYDLDAGIIPKTINELPIEDNWTDELITFQDFPKQSFFYLKCQHYFLYQDWCSYITQQIIDQSCSPFIHCMEDKCNMIVSNSEIQQLVGDKLFLKNQQKITMLYKSNTTNLKVCPSPECSSFFYLQAQTLSIECSCGFTLCTYCNSEFHSPCTCNQLKLWNSHNLEDQLSILQIQSICSQCPKCKTNINKNEGCNYMKCTFCQQAFCWVCLTFWENHTQDHFKCNQLPKKEQYKDQAKKDIEYYNFYQKRFTIFAEKQKRCQNIVLTAISEFKLKIRLQLNLNINTLDYLELSVKRIAQCMGVLKWSYIYGYFIDNEIQRDFFQEQQGHLESYSNMLYNLQLKIIDNKLEIQTMEEYDDIKNKLQNWSQQCIQQITDFQKMYHL